MEKNTEIPMKSDENIVKPEEDIKMDVDKVEDGKGTDSENVVPNKKVKELLKRPKGKKEVDIEEDIDIDSEDAEDEDFMDEESEDDFIEDDDDDEVEEEEESVVIIDEETKRQREEEEEQKRAQRRLHREHLEKENQELRRLNKVNIDYSMPEIFWHDRRQLLSVHVQPKLVESQYNSLEAKNSAISFKICTSSVQTEVRIWEITLNPKKDKSPEDPDRYDVNINFIANLEEHQHPLNFAKYSPNGEFIVSGDNQGALVLWKIFPRLDDFVPPVEPALNDEKHMFEIPVNKENWKRAFVPFRHEADVTCAAFSANSQFLVSGSEDKSIRMFNTENGKTMWRLPNFRRKIMGVTFDPTGTIIISMSIDRRLDIINSKKGQCLKTCYQTALPEQIISPTEKLAPANYKFFCDEHMYSFARQPEFTPDGQLLLAPAAELETPDEVFYGVHVFKRTDLDKGLPSRMYRTARPTFMISVMPQKLPLRQMEEGEKPFSNLQHRYIFAALCCASIYIFDTQYDHPIAYIDNTAYDNLTSISWSNDGKVLIVTNLEGYCAFLHFRSNDFSIPPVEEVKSIETPQEPQTIE